MRRRLALVPSLVERVTTTLATPVGKPLSVRLPLHWVWKRSGLRTRIEVVLPVTGDCTATISSTLTETSSTGLP